MLSLRGAVRTRRIRSIGLKLVMLGLILLIFGFAGFIWLLPSRQVALDRNADGIVVLTGGSSRVSDAMELLAGGYGKRLLISGVHPTNAASDISRSLPDNSPLMTTDLPICAKSADNGALINVLLKEAE